MVEGPQLAPDGPKTPSRFSLLAISRGETPWL